MAGKTNYLIMLAIIIYGVLFYHNYVMTALLMVFLLIPVLSFIIAAIGKKQIEIEIEVDKTSVGRNIPVDVCFCVKNHSLLPIDNCLVKYKVYNCYYPNLENYEIVIPSIPGQNRKVNFKINGRYCGRMRIDIVEMQYWDLTGIFKFKKKFDISGEYIIMPEKEIKLPQINNSVTGVAKDDEVQYKKGDDMSQISQIRDYIPGDRLSNIHWKLSSKKEELQVKEFSLPYSDEVTLLVEFSLNDKKPEILDETIEIFYAAGKFLIENGRRFRFVTFNNQTKELFENRIETESELMSSIVTMYFMTPGKGKTTYDTYRAVYHEIEGTVLYICSGDESDISGNEIDIQGEGVKISCLY